MNVLRWDGASVWSGDKEGNVELWNVSTLKKMPKLGHHGEGEEVGEGTGRMLSPDGLSGLPSKHRDKVCFLLLSYRRVMWSIAWDSDGTTIFLWD